MRLSEILAASLVAPLVAAHAGIPGVPKIFGLPPKDIAALKSRNIFGGHHARSAYPAHGSRLQARQGGNADGRCGKEFGCATCDEGYCCSSGGWCGQGQEYCQAPDSQFDYGPAADANKLPAGGTTRNVARPKVGSVVYGGEGIYVCTKPGQIAITYDDGPYIYTNDLLDLFASYKFKATFFMTGINLYKGSIDDASTAWPAVIRRMYAEGHQLASHTWSHQDLSAITKAQRYEQMVRLEMALSNIVGKFPTYMRPPYSSCTAASGCEQDMADLGYHVSYFDLDTDDYNNITPEKAQIPKDNVKAALDKANSATDEFLAIGHDIHYQTVHNLTVYMLDLMVKKGYKGVTMGECLGDPEANWYRTPSNRPATSSAFTPPACASTRASSSSISRTATVSASSAVATPTGVSQDASCGPSVGLTCLGFSGGECCSTYGYCGDTAGHCGDGCQKGFGKCGISSSSSSSLALGSSSVSGSASRTASSSAVATPTGVSQDASCGPSVGLTCIGFSGGECCSTYGYCGDTAGHCGDGCQKGFGKCGTASSSILSSSSAASTSKASSSVAATSSSVVSSSSVGSSSIASGTTRSASSSVARSSSASSSAAQSSSASSSVIRSSSASSSVARSSSVSSSAARSSSASSSVARSSSVSSSAARSSSVSSSAVRSSSVSSSAARSSSSSVARSSSSSVAQSSSSSVARSSSSSVAQSSSASSSVAGSSSASSSRIASSTPVVSSSIVASSTPQASSTPISSSRAASSTPLASSTIASSSASSKPTGSPSPNGSCGPSRGYHCMGSLFGDCCSQYGFCGRTSISCGRGCQDGYGKCNANTASGPPSFPWFPWN